MSVCVAAATAALSLAVALAMAGSALAAPDVPPAPPSVRLQLLVPGPAVGTTPPHAE